MPRELAQRRADRGGWKRENGHSLPASGAWTGQRNHLPIYYQVLRLPLSRLTLRAGGHRMKLTGTGRCPAAAGGEAAGKNHAFCLWRAGRSRMPRSSAYPRKCRHSGHRATAMPIPIETMSSRASVRPMRNRCIAKRGRLADSGAMIIPQGRTSTPNHEAARPRHRHKDVPRRHRWRSRGQKPRFLTAARWAGQDARIQRFISRAA